MNNKGFTLIEVLAVIVIFSITTIVVSKNIGTTLSASKNETYNLMKTNIISVSYEYINECQSNTVECKLDWKNNKTWFYAEELKNKGYFKDLSSPIDNKYLGQCLIINVYKNNGAYNINLKDKCY